MVALNIILIIYLNYYMVCGEEVNGNEEIEESKAEFNRNEEEISRSEEDRLLIEMIPDLYRSYRDVLKDSNETKSQRRIFKNNREYQIHVEKLKEVNGYKKHNLIIKESTRDNPVIYINNPVETKIPNAYLTLQDFKIMLTERISKQKEQFKNDYLKPKLYNNKPVPGRTKIISITKHKRKRTTLNSKDKSQTESSKNLGISTSKSIFRVNKKQYNNTVKFKTTDVPNATKINHIFEKMNQSYNVYQTTFAMSTTGKGNKTLQNELLQNSLGNDTKKSKKAKHKRVQTTKVKEKENNKTKLQENKNPETEIVINDPKNATKYNPGDTTESKEVFRANFYAKPQNVSKLDENTPLGDEIFKKSPENVTEKNIDTIPTDVTRSNLEESKQNITELDKTNQNNENVEYTSENVTEKIPEVTTEYKDIQSTDAEAIEQNISKIEETNPLRDEIEENTTTGTTEDTREVITEQIEEDTSDSEVVTEETTSTTVPTTRTRLSKPLVWLGDR